MARPLNAAAGGALLGLVAVLLACPRPAAAQSVNITYGGRPYGIVDVVGSATVLNPSLRANFYYQGFAAAQDACIQVGATLGTLNPGGAGPYFVYFLNEIAFAAVGFLPGLGSCTGLSGDLSSFSTFALSTDLDPVPSPSLDPSPSPSPEASPSASPEASPIPSPEPSPSASPEPSPEPSPSASPGASPSASPEPSPSASPGASPSASPEPSPSGSPEPSPSPSPVPLDCSLAVFSPPFLSSRVTSQICAASKAVRQGKRSKLVTNVTLSLVNANNQPAAVNITDIITNKLTAGWQCRCRPTARDNCTCLPNAVLLGGGNFLVMPQWRRSTRPGNIVDTTLQVSFTATASNGGACTGTAVICSAWGVRRNKLPPACTPFNSTGVTRPALTCV